jgi:cell division septum initiation protein DivIVA
MTMDLSAVTEEQKTYYMRLRAKIMVQLSNA